jgi:lipopolysaccharide heptosyltransferase I
MPAVRHSNHDPQTPRILLIRPTALGDVSRTVPAVVSLRQAFPTARIDWLVAEAFADVVRHHPMLDGLVSFARNRLAHFGLKPSATREGLALAKRLRQARYDRVYDLQGLFRSGLFTRLTHAPRRVGFADARELAWLGYNVRHRVDPQLHTVDRMLGLLQADGIDPVRDLRLYVGDADRRWFAQFKTEHSLSGRYSCIAPTARWGCKCWPLERYASVARRLLRDGRAGRHLIILASPAERPAVQPMLDMLHHNRRQGDVDISSRVLFPLTSVGQMMALLSDTKLLVCNDSAPLHIAVGFDRPIVAVFGPTDPAHVGPYSDRAFVVQPDRVTPADLKPYRRHLNDPSLISRVETDAVWHAIVQQIDNHCTEQPVARIR